MQTNRLGIVFAACLLAGCGGGGAGGGAYTLDLNVHHDAPQAPPAPPVVCTVEIDGDSIAAGYGVAEKPEQIIKRLRPKYSVVNTSVPGELASQRITHFYNDVRASRFIILEHGINDLYAQPTSIDPVPALRNMLAYVKAEGRQPILTGLMPQATPHPLRAGTDARIGAMAAETGTPFANVGTVAIDIATEMQDTSHPKQSGTVKMVTRWIEVLDALAPECAS